VHSLVDELKCFCRSCYIRPFVLGCAAASLGHFEVILYWNLYPWRWTRYAVSKRRALIIQWRGAPQRRITRGLLSCTAALGQKLAQACYCGGETWSCLWNFVSVCLWSDSTYLIQWLHSLQTFIIKVPALRKICCHISSSALNTGTVTCALTSCSDTCNVFCFIPLDTKINLNYS